jgi:hypothetical protein
VCVCVINDLYSRERKILTILIKINDDFQITVITTTLCVRRECALLCSGLAGNVHKLCH